LPWLAFGLPRAAQGSGAARGKELTAAAGEALLLLHTLPIIQLSIGDKLFDLSPYSSNN